MDIGDVARFLMGVVFDLTDPWPSVVKISEGIARLMVGLV